MLGIRASGEKLRGRPTQNFCCRYEDGTQEQRYFPDRMDVDVPDVCSRMYKGDPECKRTIVREKGSRKLFSGGSNTRKTKRKLRKRIQKRMKSRRLRRSTSRDVKRKRKEYVKRK